jgi:dynein heavy chain
MQRRRVTNYTLFFAAVSTFGAACDDQSRDYRAEFSQMWRSKWRNVTFPRQGTVFGYYVSPDKKKSLLWTKVNSPFQYVKRRSAGNALFFGLETTRINSFAQNLRDDGHTVILTGFAGTGKSVLIRNLLNTLNDTEFMYCTMNFKYSTHHFICRFS